MKKNAIILYTIHIPAAERRRRSLYSHKCLWQPIYKSNLKNAQSIYSYIDEENREISLNSTIFFLPFFLHVFYFLKKRERNIWKDSKLNKHFLCKAVLEANGRYQGKTDIVVYRNSWLRYSKPFNSIPPPSCCAVWLAL